MTDVTERVRTRVRERARTTRASLARIGAASAITLLIASAAASCGAGDEPDGGEAVAGTTAGTDSSTIVGSSLPAGGADATNGEQLARSAGCAGCHGSDFGGGAGPSWIGLAGSERPLADGTVVVADPAYLVRAIADPSAEVIAEYTLRMPANGLSDAEIADVVAFIETLVDE